MTNAFDMLDKNIDDIDDLAGFAVPTNGMYSLKFSTKLKDVNEKPCVEANFEVINAVELDDPSTENDPANKPGTKFSMLFQIENDMAVSRLKELMAPASAHYGEGNMLVLCRDVCATESIIVAKVKRRADKKDPDKVYANISGITFE